MSCKFCFKHASSVRHSNAWKKPNRLRKCNQCFSSTNAADAMWDINLWVKKHWKKLISIISFSSPKIELILAHVQNSEEKMPSLLRFPFDQDHLGINTLFVKISLSRNFEDVSSRGLKWNIKEKQKETAFNKSYCYQHFIDKYEDSFPWAGKQVFCNILWYFCQKSEEQDKNIVSKVRS